MGVNGDLTGIFPSDHQTRQWEIYMEVLWFNLATQQLFRRPQKDPRYFPFLITYI